MNMENIKIINTKNKGDSIITTKEIKKGEFIFKFVGRLLPQKIANNKALQIEEDLFLESTEYFDDNLNHSCDPNGYIDFNTLDLIALRDIKSGVELSFNYHISEYDLIDQGCSFKCYCGSTRCVGQVNGFKYLKTNDKEIIIKYASPYILKKYKDEQVKI